jgi:L-rhamnose mutarotase
MQQMGLCTGLKTEAVAEYKQLHAAVWPAVLAAIARSNIKNYSIFLKEPENILFAVYEYHGVDYAADMALMAQDPKTREWWTLTDPMQTPFETRAKGEWWARMEEVFHCD